MITCYGCLLEIIFILINGLYIPCALMGICIPPFGWATLIISLQMIITVVMCCAGSLIIWPWSCGAIIFACEVIFIIALSLLSLWPCAICFMCFYLSLALPLYCCVLVTNPIFICASTIFLCALLPVIPILTICIVGPLTLILGFDTICIVLLGSPICIFMVPTAFTVVSFTALQPLLCLNTLTLPCWSPTIFVIVGMACVFAPVIVFTIIALMLMLVTTMVVMRPTEEKTQPEIGEVVSGNKGVRIEPL